MTVKEKVERFNRHGYRTFHLFGPFYLVRSYGKARRWSGYQLCILRDVEV